MATAYTVPIKSTLAPHLTVRVVVMRKDGDVLSAEDLTSAGELYPPPKGKRAELMGAVKRAPQAKAAKPRKPRAKASPPAAKPVAPSRRKAAKRPPR